MALNYYKNELKENAQLLASKGKGILAVDESTKTVGKRLAGIGVENTEENRKAYRGMLFLGVPTHHGRLQQLPGQESGLVGLR